MNDFTKEELIMLKNMILHIRNDYPAVRLDTDCCVLKAKIQRMIETYDEPKYCAHSGAKLEKKNG